VSRLWQRLPESVELVVISHPPHIYYLCNFYPLPGTLNDGSTNFLLLRREGDAVLIADNWQQEVARSAYVDKTEIVDWYSFRGSPPQRREATEEALLDLLTETRGGVGVEPLHLSSHVSAALMKRQGNSELWDVAADVRALRRHKDEDELAVIRAAVGIGEVGHEAARNAATQGATELQVWGAVHSACVSQAGEPIQMMGDFASGTERSAQGGGPPTTRILQNGDLFIIDFYPVIHGYRCDITNTLVVGGQVTLQQQGYFDVVRRAMEAAEKRLVPGTPAADIYRAVWEAFSDAGLSRRFPHHAGHGLGLAHPEPPFFVPESEEVLEIGDVVTLEPGIYVKGFGGIRLEHEYLITADGAQKLSNHF
jgi:Xaa-Pro aminopeptidase